MARPKKVPVPPKPRTRQAVRKAPPRSRRGVFAWTLRNGRLIRDLATERAER